MLSVKKCLYFHLIRFFLDLRTACIKSNQLTAALQYTRPRHVKKSEGSIFSDFSMKKKHCPLSIGLDYSGQTVFCNRATAPPYLSIALHQRPPDVADVRVKKRGNFEQDRV